MTAAKGHITDDEGPRVLVIDMLFSDAHKEKIVFDKTRATMIYWFNEGVYKEYTTEKFFFDVFGYKGAKHKEFYKTCSKMLANYIKSEKKWRSSGYGMIPPNFREDKRIEMTWSLNLILLEILGKGVAPSIDEVYVVDRFYKDYGHLIVSS